MYDALAKSMQEQTGTVAKQYDTTAQNLDAAFQGATNDINATAATSMDNVSAQLKKLGIQEAGAEAFDSQAQEQGRAVNNVAGIQASFAGANEALKQSQQDYLTNSANTAGIAGANARADIMQALQQTLGGYDAKELEIKAQEGGTLNDYLMQIAGMQQESNAAAQGSFLDWLDQQNDQQRWAFEQEESRRRWESENEMERARAALELEKFQQEVASGGAGNRENWDNNAPGYIANLASQYFDDPQMAGAVADQIMTAFAHAPAQDKQTASGFIRFVNNRFPGNANRAQYAALAGALAQAMGLKG